MSAAFVVESDPLRYWVEDDDSYAEFALDVAPERLARWRAAFTEFEAVQDDIAAAIGERRRVPQ